MFTIKKKFNKSTLISAIPLIIIAFAIMKFSANTTLVLSSDISLISITQGTTGALHEVTDPEEIAEITKTINALKLIQQKRLEDSTGFTLMMNLGADDSGNNMQIILRNDGVIYDGYLYGNGKNITALLDSYVERYF